MKLLNSAKTALAAVFIVGSGVVVADDSADKQPVSGVEGWTPYSLSSPSLSSSALSSSALSSRTTSSSEYGLLDYYPHSTMVSVYQKNSDTTAKALSMSFEDDSDGLWQVSLDVNQSSSSNFAEEQYSFNASYSPGKENTKFYIDYGNRRVPVSIKVDDFLDYNKSGYSGQNLNVGLEQKLSDSWAVSISYTKSDLEQVSSDSGILGFERDLPTNQRYWFDLNKDGLPEAVNLFSELGTSANFNKALDGIEIRLTRQVSEQLSVGSVINKSNMAFDWEPYQFNRIGTSGSDMTEETLSLFSQFDFSKQWSLDANISRQFYENRSSQVVSLVAADAQNVTFDNTTLDIGLQYEGRWDDVGLVIRIDLVNLLGVESDSLQHGQAFDDSGLAPYTFQSPKYIKLSGSINF